MKPIKYTEIEKIPEVLCIKKLMDKGSKEDNLSWGIKITNNLLEIVKIDEEAVNIYNLLLSNKTKIKVSEARLYAQKMHKYARETNDLSKCFTYRALGHLIATIHVSTHTYGVIIYSFKAYYQLGDDIDKLKEKAIKYLTMK